MCQVPTSSNTQPPPPSICFDSLEISFSFGCNLIVELSLALPCPAPLWCVIRNHIIRRPYNKHTHTCKIHLYVTGPLGWIDNVGKPAERSSGSVRFPIETSVRLYQRETLRHVELFLSFLCDVPTFQVSLCVCVCVCVWGIAHDN